MSSLQIFNGITIPSENEIDVDLLEGEIENEISDKYDVKLLIYPDGILITDKARGFYETSVYSPGNSDNFYDTWVGVGGVSRQCNVWPLAADVPQPEEDEINRCQQAADELINHLQAQDITASPSPFGLHICCDD